MYRLDGMRHPRGHLDSSAHYKCATALRKSPDGGGLGDRSFVSLYSSLSLSLSLSPLSLSLSLARSLSLSSLPLSLSLSVCLSCARSLSLTRSLCLSVKADMVCQNKRIRLHHLTWSKCVCARMSKCVCARMRPARRRAHRNRANRPHVQRWGRTPRDPSQSLQYADTACNLKHPANKAGRMGRGKQRIR